MHPILTITDLHKSYQKGSVEILALQGVSLEVRSGEFLSVVGRSGSGKSTLLNLIGGLDTATSGTIRIKGRELTRMKRPDLARHRRKTVGMVFQSFNLIPSRTARENVELALAFGNVGRKDRKQRAKELLGNLGLAERLDHVPAELSGGEAQRVAVARALANRPDILLADEPTGNLDSATAREILDLLADLNRNRKVTVIMVTHDRKSAESVSHRVMEFLDGRIVRESRTGRKP